MLNVGVGELALIFIAALLVLGPSRLPELARGLGKFLREFRRQTDDIRTVVEREFYSLDDQLKIDTRLDLPPVPARATLPPLSETEATDPHAEKNRTLSEEDALVTATDGKVVTPVAKLREDTRDKA